MANPGIEGSAHNVAVVIVLYNPSDEETANVRRLSEAHTGVIVDNSPEPAFGGDHLGRMHYVSLQENVGVAKAQNIGSRYVLDHTEATHIVFLDQDSTVATSYPQDIAYYFEKIKHDFPRLAFLGPSTENKETGKEYKSVIHKDHALSDDFIPRRELISSGGCTTREVLADVGLNDERLFIDYVDFEWCWRARSKGYICGFTPNVTIKHMVGQKTIYVCGYTIIISSPVRYYYQFRNHLWLSRRGYVPLQWKINHGIKNLARLIYFPILVKYGGKCWKNMVRGLAAGLGPLMKTISIYVENARLTPSAYYRLTQYFQPSEARLHSALPDCVYRWWHGLGKTGRRVFSIPLYVFYVLRTLAFLIEDNLSMSNGMVILARAIVPRRLPSLHKYLIRRLAKRNKLVWDFDDNILANRRISPADFYFHSRYSDTIVVSTDILMSLIDKKFVHKVKILPTTDGDFLGYDTQKVLSQRQSLYDEEIRLVWVATALGLEYIQPIVPSLDDAAKALRELNGKKLSLHVVCNKPLLAETSCLEIVNILWDRDVAKKEITNSHIGLMPLPDNEFTRGKGGFKLIQYMSTAMPVIASAVGFNNQIVTKDFGYLINPSNDQTTNSPNDQTTWKDAVIELASDWERYARMAKNAKDCYDKHFSYDKNKEFWEQLTCLSQNGR